MTEKSGLKFFCSIFLILALIAPSVSSIQGFQIAQAKIQVLQLDSPPPPSTPYWTYKGLGGVEAVAVSEDGGTVVAGILDGTIHAFGRQSNMTLWNYSTGFSGINSVAVSANGSTIVAGGGDGKIHVFGRQSNTTIWNYDTGNYVSTVAVSADGNTIVAGGGDGKIHVFGRLSNTPIWNYITPGYYLVHSVSVSADGNTIAEASNDGYVRVFGRNSNTTLWSYSTAYIMYGVAVSRDGKTISAGGMDGYLKVFNRLGNTPLLNFDTGNGISNVVAISSDGSTIACGNANGANSRVYLFSKFSGLQWDYAVPDDISTLFGPGVGISGDGTLVAYGCSDYKLYVFQYDYDAPVIGTPAVAPPSPVGGQSASISVSVTDNLEVFGVTLHYWNSVTSSWSSVPMSPAGAAYEATIGPFSSGDVVSYYVSATDTSGNTASSPASAPLSYYTFTVGVSSEGALVSQNMISVLIGVALGAVIVIVASFAMMRGKKSRR